MSDVTLTDAEREALLDALVMTPLSDTAGADLLPFRQSVEVLRPAIERIVADRLERIAQAIEAMESFANGKNDLGRAHLIGFGVAKRRSVRILRDGE